MSKSIDIARVFAAAILASTICVTLIYEKTPWIIAVPCAWIVGSFVMPRDEESDYSSR